MKFIYNSYLPSCGGHTDSNICSISSTSDIEIIQDQEKIQKPNAHEDIFESSPIQRICLYS